MQAGNKRFYQVFAIKLLFFTLLFSGGCSGFLDKYYAISIPGAIKDLRCKFSSSENSFVLALVFLTAKLLQVKKIYSLPTSPHKFVR